MGDFDRKWRQQHEVRDTFLNDVSRGKVIGSYGVTTYGRVVIQLDERNVPVKTIDGITDGTVPVPPQSGEQMSVVSTSASDTDGGTGVQSIIIEYLNHNLDLSYELVTLNGLTPVLTIATNIRWIQRIYSASLGSNLLAVGNVVVSGVTTSNDYENIPSGQRSGDTSFYRVPRGKRLLIGSMFAGSSSGTAGSRCRIELVTSKIGAVDQSESGILYSHAGVVVQDGNAELATNIPFAVEEGVITGMIASNDKGARVTAGFNGWIENAV